jgi:predicted GH43/DUF377 family glycosyl hydrolase
VSWQIGPFTRDDNMLLEADAALAWAAKDVFNPAAVVRAGRVHLLVRGEDTVGRFAGTSRIGLATSDDGGVTFSVERDPVLVPTLPEEHEGGCEDPRVVEDPDGSYVCTYTGFDGARPLLMVATSPDLRTWTKHGSAFAGTPYAERATKSGAIVTSLVDGRLVATRIGDRYWMYWGERVLYIATSEDLVHWTPLDFDATGDRTLSFEDGRWRVHQHEGVRALRPVLMPRRGRFDARLTEAGPPAVLTDDGIVVIYNGADETMAYAPGQALFDPLDPTACIARATEPFLRPESAAEQRGQVANVCFAEGLVRVGDEWRLYYGMADSRIGCATAPAS